MISIFLAISYAQSAQSKLPKPGTLAAKFRIHGAKRADILWYPERPRSRRVLNVSQLSVLAPQLSFRLWAGASDISNFRTRLAWISKDSTNFAPRPTKIRIPYITHQFTRLLVYFEERHLRANHRISRSTGRILVEAGIFSPSTQMNHLPSINISGRRFHVSGG